MITSKSINPGVLDRRITLRFPVKSRGTDGSAVEAFTDAVTVWAQRLAQNSRVFQSAQALNGEVTEVMRIRWRADVGPTWRIWYESTSYRVVGQPIEVGRREYLDIPLAVVNRPAFLVDENGQIIRDENNQPITV